MSRAALARLVAGCVVIALPTAPGFDGSPWVAQTLGQGREWVMYVSVVDPATQQPVRHLGIDAFVVREDGTSREVLRVTPADTPMPVAVVIDNSQAMAPAISDLRRGLTAFLNSIDGIGPVTLVTIADRPTIALGYTTSKQELLETASRVFHGPNSGATLLDAISDVAKGLGRRESDRAAIVAITGEHTDFSHLQYRDVLDHLHASEASLHVVVLVNPAGSYSSDEARNRATVLDRGPRESGGVRMDLLSSMSLESRLKDLAAILKSQYRVVYARPESLIPPEKIEVSSAKQGLEAHGRPARGQVAK